MGVDASLHSLSNIGGVTRDNERYAILLIQAAGVSLRSVANLLDRSYMAARDALTISRSICDACVNASFLMVSEEEIGHKASRYITQRFHRDRHRSSSVGGVTIQIRPHVTVSVDDVPQLNAALAEFTSKSGREIREWSGFDVDEKIEAVSAVCPKAGQSLAASRISIYGTSSEIIHGSPYGAVYFWSIREGSPLTENVRRQLMGHYLHAIAGSLFALDGLLAVAEDRFNADISIWRKAVHWEFLTTLVNINFHTSVTSSE